MGIRRRTNEFKKGDVYKAQRKCDSKPHVWIIMHDCKYADTHCVRAFNLTSSPAPEKEYMIDVSHHKFPADWFDYQKDKTCVRINEDDCLFKKDIIKYLGDIYESCPGLMDEICNKTYSCDVAADLDDMCDCNYQIMDRKVDLKIILMPPCDCNDSSVLYH